MTPPATAASRRLATVVAAGVVLCPLGSLLAAPAFAADPVSPASATPTVGIGEPAYAEASPSPSEWPDSGGWIIGGTLQEGSQAGSAAAPPVRPVRPARPAAPAGPVVPVAKPVTVKAPVARVPVVTAPARPAAAGAPTALPFTGPARLPVQLGLGGGLVLLGAALTAAARPKGTLRHTA